MPVAEKGGNNKVEGKKIRLPEKNLREAENNLKILSAEGLSAAGVICYDIDVNFYTKGVDTDADARDNRKASKQASKQANVGVFCLFVNTQIINFVLNRRIASVI